MSEIIKIHQLSKTYRGSHHPAISHLTVSIKKGITGILGPNGAGKTTLIHILTGLIKSFEGSVSCFDFPIPQKRQKVKPLIGMVPQEIALYYDLTAFENLLFFGSLYGISRQKITDTANLYLHELGLYERRYDKVKTFSGGMKRRINLICGLLHQPQLLLLDEATTGVDVQSKQVILNFLASIHRNGTNIIYTSHQMEDVQQLCNDVIIMDNGKLIEQDSMEHLLSKYENCTNLEQVFLHLTGNTLRP